MTEIDNETLKPYQRSVFDTMSNSFGSQLAIDTDKAVAALQLASDSQLGPEDIPNVTSDARVDEMVDVLEPEWCYRQFRWFAADSGCRNGGINGAEGCFMFKAGNYVSETHTVKSSSPQDLLDDREAIS